MVNILENDSQILSTRYDIQVTSALYSSIIGIVRSWIKGHFPKDFFKNEFVENSIYTVVNAGASDEDKLVIEVPSVSIKMNYEEQQGSFSGDNFLYGNMLVKKAAWLQPVVYNRIAWDRNEGIYITSPPRRSKNTLDITFRFNSDIQALNTLGYLKNKVGENRPQFLNKRIVEVPFPPSIIASVAIAKGYDLSNIDSLKAFNESLSKMSDGLITYKVNSSSGRYLYFFKYMTNILLRVESYSVPEKTMKDHSVTFTECNMSISLDFTTFSSFIVETFKKIPDVPNKYYDRIVSDTEIGTSIFLSINTPVSSMLPDGRKIIYSSNIVSDINVYLDKTTFMGDLPSDIGNYISHLKEKDPTLKLLKDKIGSRVYKDGVELELEYDYEVDWSIGDLVLKYPSPNHSYIFLLYADLREVNDFNNTFNKPNNI